jgi:hypothetical protein
MTPFLPLVKTSSARNARARFFGETTLFYETLREFAF